MDARRRRCVCVCVCVCVRLFYFGSATQPATCPFACADAFSFSSFSSRRWGHDDPTNRSGYFRRRVGLQSSSRVAASDLISGATRQAGSHPLLEPCLVISLFVHLSVFVIPSARLGAATERRGFPRKRRANTKEKNKKRRWWWRCSFFLGVEPWESLELSLNWDVPRLARRDWRTPLNLTPLPYTLLSRPTRSISKILPGDHTKRNCKSRLTFHEHPAEVGQLEVV